MEMKQLLGPCLENVVRGEQFLLLLLVNTYRRLLRLKSVQKRLVKKSNTNIIKH